MLSRRPRFFTLLSLCLLLWLTPATAADIQTTEKQIKALQQDIKSLEQQLSQFQGRQRTLQKQLRQSEEQAAALHKQMAANEASIESLKQRLAELSREQQTLEQRRQAEQKILRKQLVSAYRTGYQDQLKLLLNQQDPERVSRMMHYYDYLSEERIAALRSFQQTLVSLQQVEQDIAERQQQLTAQQQQLQQQAQQLRAQREERSKTLKSLKADIGSGSERLAQMKADQQRLHSVIEKLQQSLEKADLDWQNTAFRSLKGKLQWPVSGRLAAGYGSRNAQGMKSEGIVISAPAGRSVAAVHHGRVVFSDWLRGFGLLIIIDHGSGYMSLYGHNQTLLKEVGDWVAAQEPIATVGDSGGLSDAGLYFAIRYKGRPYNPQPWLSPNQG